MLIHNTDYAQECIYCKNKPNFLNTHIQNLSHCFFMLIVMQFQWLLLLLRKQEEKDVTQNQQNLLQGLFQNMRSAPEEAT